MKTREEILEELAKVRHDAELGLQVSAKLCDLLEDAVYLLDDAAIRKLTPKEIAAASYKPAADPSKEREEFQQEQREAEKEVISFIDTLRDPDVLGSAEYRAVYELISEADSLYVVQGILMEFQNSATSIKTMLEVFIDENRKA